MINNTKVKIPKKYHHMIEMIETESDSVGYKESFNGYWIYTNKGYSIGDDDNTHVAVEETQKELLRQIRGIKECRCKECLK